MIAVIDYGMGNLRSVQKALETVGARAILTHDPQEILNADSVVLPGVGAFKDCMANLKRLGLVDPVRATIESGKPFLGICLGLQLKFEESEEFGPVHGLGILPGKVVRFPEGGSETESGAPMKIPHMGWNSVRFNTNHPVLEGITQDSFFYFVHSYYASPEDPAGVSGTTEYGIPFCSIYAKDNLVATQFHPEKSGPAGLRFYKNFIGLASA